MMRVPSQALPGRHTMRGDADPATVTARPPRSAGQPAAPAVRARSAGGGRGRLLGPALRGRASSSPAWPSRGRASGPATAATSRAPSRPQTPPRRRPRHRRRSRSSVARRPPRGHGRATAARPRPRPRSRRPAPPAALTGYQWPLPEGRLTLRVRAVAVGLARRRRRAVPRRHRPRHVLRRPRRRGPRGHGPGRRPALRRSCMGWVGDLEPLPRPARRRRSCTGTLPIVVDHRRRQRLSQHLRPLRRR